MTFENVCRLKTNVKLSVSTPTRCFRTLVHCSTLQHTATNTATHMCVCGSAPRQQHAFPALWCTTNHRNPLQHTATRCNTYTERHCNTLQHTATHRNPLQITATHGSTRQHTATHGNTLQHTHTNSELDLVAPCVLIAVWTNTHVARQHTATHSNTQQHAATNTYSLTHTHARELRTRPCGTVGDDSSWAWRCCAWYLHVRY